jgi:hypothetical protein
VYPDSRLLVLADNKMQVEVERTWFETCDYVSMWVNQMSSTQRTEWMRRMAGGTDPVTAFYESVQTRLKHGDDEAALRETTDLWAAHFGDDPAQAWSAYEQKRDHLRDILLRRPMLIEMFQAFAVRKDNENDGSATTKD